MGVFSELIKEDVIKRSRYVISHDDIYERLLQRDILAPRHAYQNLQAKCIITGLDNLPRA